MSFLAGADLVSHRRAAQRVVYHRKGTLALGSKNAVSVKTIDISSSGVGIFSPHPVPEKQSCVLRGRYAAGE